MASPTPATTSFYSTWLGGRGRAGTSATRQQAVGPMSAATVQEIAGSSSADVGEIQSHESSYAEVAEPPPRPPKRIAVRYKPLSSKETVALVYEPPSLPPRTRPAAPAAPRCGPPPDALPPSVPAPPAQWTLPQSAAELSPPSPSSFV